MSDGIEPSTLSLQVARANFSKIERVKKVNFPDKKNVVAQQKIVSWSGTVYSPFRV